jgi:hypothetical protein
MLMKFTGSTDGGVRPEPRGFACAQSRQAPLKRSHFGDDTPEEHRDDVLSEHRIFASEEPEMVERVRSFKAFVIGRYQRREGSKVVTTFLMYITCE